MIVLVSNKNCMVSLSKKDWKDRKTYTNPCKCFWLIEMHSLKHSSACEEKKKNRVAWSECVVQKVYKMHGRQISYNQKKLNAKGGNTINPEKNTLRKTVKKDM